MEKIPNAQVWILGREYVEAAEILVEELKLWPAAVLAALSIEIFIKSFLIETDPEGYISTKRGHRLTDLFSKISDEDRNEILRQLNRIDSSYGTNESLNKFNDTFTSARYRYEKNATKNVGNDIVIFARHLCDAISELGKHRGL